MVYYLIFSIGNEKQASDGLSNFVKAACYLVNRQTPVSLFHYAAFLFHN